MEFVTFSIGWVVGGNGLKKRTNVETKNLTQTFLI